MEADRHERAQLVSYIRQVPQQNKVTFESVVSIARIERAQRALPDRNDAGRPGLVVTIVQPTPRTVGAGLPSVRTLRSASGGSLCDVLLPPTFLTTWLHCLRATFLAERRHTMRWVPWRPTPCYFEWFATDTTPHNFNQMATQSDVNGKLKEIRDESCPGGKSGCTRVMRLFRPNFRDGCESDHLWKNPSTDQFHRAPSYTSCHKLEQATRVI